MEPFMANLSIKDVPDALAERLRQRALRNHRSLQGELMAIVEAAAFAGSRSAPEQASAYVAVDSRTTTGVFAVDRRSGVSGNSGHSGSRTIEQIASEHRARFPQPFRDGPLAVDLIRADRDTR